MDKLHKLGLQKTCVGFLLPTWDFGRLKVGDEVNCRHLVILLSFFFLLFPCSCGNRGLSCWPSIMGRKEDYKVRLRPTLTPSHTPPPHYCCSDLCCPLSDHLHHFSSGRFCCCFCYRCCWWDNSHTTPSWCSAEQSNTQKCFLTPFFPIKIALLFTHSILYCLLCWECKMVFSGTR